LGERFSPISTFFSLVKSREFRYAPHSQVWFWDFKLCLLDFQNLLDLALSQIYTHVFNWGSLSLWTMLGLGIVSHLYFSLSRVFARLAMQQTRVFGSGLFKNASFGALPNLYKRISLVEVYRF